MPKMLDIKELEKEINEFDKTLYNEDEDETPFWERY